MASSTVTASTPSPRHPKAIRSMTTRNLQILVRQSEVYQQLRPRFAPRQFAHPKGQSGSIRSTSENVCVERCRISGRIGVPILLEELSRRYEALAHRYERSSAAVCLRSPKSEAI